MKSVEVQGNQIIVNLRQPNVLPHALLQWVLPDDSSLPGGLPGPYGQPEITEEESVFKLRSTAKATSQPVEIVEVHYRSPKEAINDLLRERIDILDQVFPADARDLAADSRVRVFSYALPTTHLLIPISDHAYLAKEKFRRALLYATNREKILKEELLGTPDPRDGRLVSGPFPVRENDPLAYAYDATIQPVGYNPQLAKLLLIIAGQELTAAAKKSGETPPELEKLVVGCPDYELARVGVQALMQGWSNIGINSEIISIDPSSPAELIQQCDLLYVSATMWEPATDIERLLGSSGLMTSNNPFVVQALERIRLSKNWREVRQSMQEMHRVISYHLPLIPLWQIQDRFAVGKRLQGINNLPLTLYQDLPNWRFNVGSAKGGR
jgi:ABC-type transport system substrate-binding protein